MATTTTRGRPAGSGINDTKIIKKITGLMAKDPGLKATTAIKATGITDPSSIRRLRDKLKTGPAAKTPTAKKSKGKPKARAAQAEKTAKASAAKTPTPKKKSPVKKTVTTRKATKAKTTAARQKSPPKKSAPNKSSAKITVTTRTAATSRAAPKKPVENKTVESRRTPSKSATNALLKNPFEDLANTFGEMAKGMPNMANGKALPTGMGDLDIESVVTSTVEKQIQFYESALKFSPIANLLRQQALLTDLMLTMLRTQKEFSKNIKPKN